MTILLRNKQEQAMERICVIVQMLALSNWIALAGILLPPLGILTIFLVRLDRRTQLLVVDVKRLDTRMTNIAEDISVLKTDVKELKIEVIAIKQNLAVLTKDVNILKDDVALLKVDVAVLKSEVSNIVVDLEGIKLDVISLRKETTDMHIDLSVIRTDMKWVNQEQVPSITRRLNNVEEKVDDLWVIAKAASASPIRLNESGEKLLRQSTIPQMMDQRYYEILAEVKGTNPTNRYWAQKNLMVVVHRLKEDPETLSWLEATAYEGGVSVNTVLLVAAIYLRDKIIADLGFEPMKSKPTPLG